MSANTDALILAANAATTALKATKAANKDALESAFIESALATFLAVKSSKNGASRLAEINKAAGVGYGSPAAVGYHAVTGQFLSLPEGEWEDDAPSAQKVQSVVKKVGQVEAKAIVGKAKSQSVAFDRLVAAVKEDEVDIVKVLKEAFKQASIAEESRLLGNALPDEAADIVRQIRLALDNVVLGDAAAEAAAKESEGEFRVLDLEHLTLAQ